jgi:hypothetical protein
MWVATSHKWFGGNQHGFLPGKSTVSAMHSLAIVVGTSRSNRKHAAVVFLDISGAFDCTWPAAVLAALSKRKCPHYLIEIISSLFLDRIGIIKTSKGKYSCGAEIGCPQGGVLFPFLWIILAEELICQSYPFPFTIIGYADDIAIVCWHKVSEIAMRNLQIIFNDTITNCDRYLLDINARKTTLMIFSNKKTVDNCYIIVKDTKILLSTTSNFVGFLLDEKLNWKSHVEAKCQTTQRQIYTLWRCLGRTWGLDTNKLVTQYKTIIVPKLLYGCSIWCRVILIKTYKSKIQSLQRTMLKCITTSSNSVSLNALLIISNLLQIDLKILEFTATYYLSHKQEPFAPSSAATIGAVLQNLQLDHQIDHTRMFHSKRHPPWVTISISYDTVEAIPLLSQERNSLVIYGTSYKSTAGKAFGEV